MQYYLFLASVSSLSLPWAAARRRMLLFPPETRALWDLVAGLRLLVGVLLSGVPLPLSLSLSRAPEGGIASNICSMLENPGAQIEADLVFRRSEFSIFLKLSLPCHRFFYLKSPTTNFSLTYIDTLSIFRNNFLPFRELSSNLAKILYSYFTYVWSQSRTCIIQFILSTTLIIVFSHLQTQTFADVFGTVLFLMKFFAENVMPRVIFEMFFWVSWNIRNIQYIISSNSIISKGARYIDIFERTA